MFSNLIKTILPAALALWIFMLAPGASADVGTMQAGTTNKLQRRHSGSYTWCNVKVWYHHNKEPLSLEWPMEWKSGTYKIDTVGNITSASYDPPYMVGNTLVNANMVLVGSHFRVNLQLRVASDGDIEGVALVLVTHGGAIPKKQPPFGLQCSDDPAHEYKNIIPAY
ncbi:uncharacterized protein L969DRAFT_18096 [Mixia osmundae IAM 14324]|uniref:Uncharacterized protein n=1 Tax=Mixia osmundae (strain CBS 9802 / IAM 14324 / JCM 22182 / KY 12970) TaxID=764103 RepID=G7E6Y2_MIXOS|nr:uncharacterized protein L969DRAFT_18096 [Mixia osmundae IAM 14324]KEI39024.1 hypothetical protein L969DRAFT_18096 [Mixia osmundae IAM 14324]GAA98592.1 hypothetical protein E5Q_05279 [Mixia osmundae IAM 14324]